ncbi:MAG: sigma-54 dependent transcriptional regulator [Verrucomicrobiota bacterium]
MKQDMTAVLPEGQPVPKPLERCGLHLQTFRDDEVRELDPNSIHWIYFIPSSLLKDPVWPVLRVRLAQGRRMFIVYGEAKPSSAVVQAMRDGAFDFVYSDEPAARWNHAAQEASNSQQLWFQLYGSHTASRPSLLVGKSSAIRALSELILRVAPTPASVLVEGESGTGKEMVAQSLHEASGLAGPFLPVNCAAIPRELIEAELFGAEKGAYTGAHQARAGLVEQANGGTLFLDEIGEMDLDLQPKLLRFLETRRARRVGGSKEYKAEVRIVAATNRDLEIQIGRGDFRADLFYRLAEVVLKVLPLRSHLEDIPELASHFLNEANEKFGRHFLSLDPHLLSAMMHHDWPGNVRELRSTIHRLTVFHDGPVLRQEWWKKPEEKKPAIEATASAAPGGIHGTGPGLSRLQKWEMAGKLLQESGNDLTWTAARLGIHPTTLFRWIKSGRVPVPEKL